MKVVEVIKKVFLTTLTVMFFAFAIIMTFLLLNFNDYGVTKVGSTSLVIINDDIASEKYKKGDLVIVEEKRLRNIKVGDELFVYRIDSRGKANIELGNVGQVHEDSEAISFENGDNYSYEFIIGIAQNKYSGIGTFLSIVESKWGFLFAILVPSFLFFIYQVYALIVEIKYGDQE